MAKLLLWLLQGRWYEAANAVNAHLGPRLPAAWRKKLSSPQVQKAIDRVIPTPRVPEFIELRASASRSRRSDDFDGRDLNSSTYGSRRPYLPPSQEMRDSTVANYLAGRTQYPVRRVAVFTAIAGSYDRIPLHEYLDPAFDYHFFTDAKCDDLGFLTVRPADYFNVDRARTARFIKTHPHTLLSAYEFAVWADGNVVIRGDISGLIADFAASGQAVAAVPHPLRTSVYEEAAECIKRNKDDLELIRTQVGEYAARDFDCADLVESNFLMFNLQHPQLPEFLGRWWREIERGSRRDQLSFNYALSASELRYHKLTQRPDSVRNHPALALLPHLPTRETDVLPATDEPYVLSFAQVRDARIAQAKGVDIDVVICVHNALADVRQCLASLMRSKAGGNLRVILVDDGSSKDTKDFLAAFRDDEKATLVRNDEPVGYTRAANAGLERSSAPFVVLLNSDTIVTPGWAEKLFIASLSEPGVGIVGPLSNAASQQSIPDIQSSSGQTAVNPLPTGTTPDDMNTYCESWASERPLVRTPLAHGFCLGIRREVIDAIGVFDEVNFPHGYGEENDYCLRALDVGFTCGIDTSTYVWHAKSKSYESARRIALSEAGNARVAALHGRERVRRAILSMQANPRLQRVRAESSKLYKL